MQAARLTVLLSCAAVVTACTPLTGAPAGHTGAAGPPAGPSTAATTQPAAALTPASVSPQPGAATQATDDPTPVDGDAAPDAATTPPDPGRSETAGPTESSGAASSGMPTATGRSLVFAEEFDTGDGLDPQHWTPAGGVSVADGTLVITSLTAGAEPLPGGSVSSKDRRSFTYGRFEARILIPVEGGAPAFRLLPEDEVYATSAEADRRWPVNGRITVVEPGATPSTLVGSADLVRGGTAAADAGSFDTGSALSAGYHVYAVDWMPHTLTWLVDGVPYHSMDVSRPFDDRRPFDEQFYLQIGVEHTGPADGGSSPPDAMLVDWVRVFQ